MSVEPMEKSKIMTVVRQGNRDKMFNLQHKTEILIRRTDKHQLSQD